MTSEPGVQSRTFYLDASVLAKRYLAETGSAWVESLCADEAEVDDADSESGGLCQAGGQMTDSTATTVSDSELRLKGIEILNRDLGPVLALRFLILLSCEH